MPNKKSFSKIIATFVLFSFLFTSLSTFAVASTYDYDAAGNLTKETKDNGEVITYGYDSFNRLTTVTDKNGTTTYVYGDGNDIVKKILPDGRFHLYYGKLAELDPDGNWIDYLYLDPITQTHLISIVDKNGTHTVISDHLGSPSLILDAQGNVEQKIDYLPFGQERVNQITAPSPFANTTPPTPFGFTGQRKNNDGSDLLHYGARFYHPALMRFTQQDPVVVNTTRPEFQEALYNPQRLNPYAYAENNPIKNVDPTGEVSKKALFLDPHGTFGQIVAWSGTAMVFRAINRKISAVLLERSLTLNPGPIAVTADNSYSYIVQAIKDSPEYQKYVDEYIREADAGGNITIDNSLEMSTNKLEFNSGDLATSIHGTTSTRITGHKIQTGEWEIGVTITDKYDYGPPEKKDPLIKKVGINAARLAQKSEVISPYKITIEFDDTRHGAAQAPDNQQKK